MKESSLRVISGTTIVALTLFFIYCQSLFVAFSFIFIVGIVMAMEWNTITMARKNSKTWLLFGIVYITCSLLPILRLKLMGPRGNHLLMWLFIIVWSMDTFAYLVGYALGLGKHKINSISPGKSYEGLLGGIFFSIIFGFIFSHLYMPEQELVLLCITPVLCCLEQAGDFTESYVKRTFGFKNSGDIIPGHGGFLDRFDGFLYINFLLLCIV
ncbi:MAG: phosphatidate cytidylyltransferase [Rickettsiales bacterium]|jgi:phosphatidate cytidylyltransferase|nr:phosphatidate cytidylyltransferase [Rickettsiales bacterium]